MVTLTYSFVDSIVGWSVFDVNEWVMKETIARHAVIGIALQQSVQQVTTLVRHLHSSRQLKMNFYKPVTYCVCAYIRNVLEQFDCFDTIS